MNGDAAEDSLDAEPNADDFSDSPEEEAAESSLATPDEQQQGEEPPVPSSENQGDAGADQPPRGLSPAAREEWANTPDAVKNEFKRIDERLEGMAIKYSENANRALGMDEKLRPFTDLFQANGNQVGQTITDVLGLARAVQLGNQEQKVQALAHVITRNAVDLKMLDQALAGAAQMSATPDPRYQQLEARVNGIEAAKQQEIARMQAESNAQASQFVEKFGADKEFFQDVRGIMANLMEAAEAAGEELDLDGAYQRACLVHPEISKVMMQRNSKANPERKRAAASSVHGRQASDSVAPSDSLRDEIARSWDDAGRV